MESDNQGGDLKLLAKPSKVMTALEAIRLHLQHSVPKSLKNVEANFDPQGSATAESQGS